MNNDALRRNRLADVRVGDTCTSLQFGCYVDGHWGQYAPDRLADLLDSLSISIHPDEDPRTLRELAERHESLSSALDLWEQYHDATDRLTDRLNEHTVGGYWEWSDGELFLDAACCDCGTPVSEEDMNCDECHPPHWVCTDCAMWHANGEDTYESDECRQRAQSGPHFAIGQRTDTFSWSRCDCCGSTLGGTRHTAWTVN